jgi:tRNA uridine 5-carbamoylmethylation protein Kti12
LLVLCGIPGSGKSHVATKTREFFSAAYDVRVVSFDSIERSLRVNTAQFERDCWKDSRAYAYDLVRLELSRALDAEAPKAALVIVDDTMQYSSMRRQMYVAAREGEPRCMMSASP